MNSSNDNIHTVSGVAQDKKIHVRALGKGGRSKSKLNSFPQADRNWKPTVTEINVFALRLGRKMGALHSICTRVGTFAWATFFHIWTKSF